jgi:diadenosine tetraphosphate (Ap4A) HIT family hydrolase
MKKGSPPNRIDQFIQALELQKKQGPHKPVMMLAVLDMIALHGQNRFEFSDELIQHFSAYFKLVQAGNDQCTPENPFWHLKTAKDDPLWDHVVREGADTEYHCKESGKKTGMSRKWIRDNIEFAALEPKWFSLLQTASARNTVRYSIAQRYFPQQAGALLALCKEPEQPVLVDSPFTPIDPGQIIMQNDYAVAFFDRYPVSEGHALIVPKKVLASMYDLPKAWQNELWSASGEVRSILKDWYAPDAFNIGLNDGPAAGQTVMHSHIHVIPRYTGDQPDPRGGIRKIFPDKAAYWNKVA